MRRQRWLIPLLALSWAGLCVPLEADPMNRGFLRGMVVSCPRAGQIWGSPEMARSLAEITTLGADWIAIHPYARIEKNGDVRYRTAVDMDYLARAAELAGAAEVEIFWKPHLAYWGNFEWRGAIEFADDATWRRFFDTYRAFIVDQARFAESIGIELFAVGVELERTTQHESDWRRIIAAVRQVFSGRLTYAANWDSLDQVPFWDALDLIGVHAYFPLAGEDDVLDRATIWQGWDAPLATLETLSKAEGDKPVLFAEIGYPRSRRAAFEPWIPDNLDTPAVQSLRRLLIEVAAERVEAAPFVAGMFWWKWIPGDNRWDRDFSMKDTEARRAMMDSWGRSGSIPAAPQ